LSFPRVQLFLPKTLQFLVASLIGGCWIARNSFFFPTRDPGSIPKRFHLGFWVAGKPFLFLKADGPPRLFSHFPLSFRRLFFYQQVRLCGGRIPKKLFHPPRARRSYFFPRGRWVSSDPVRTLFFGTLWFGPFSVKPWPFFPFLEMSFGANPAIGSPPFPF